MATRLAGGWPLRRTFLVGFVIVTLFSLAAIVLGGTALASLASARDRVVNKIDPAAFRTSQLGIAYLNQETGVRGYALSARPTFLAPYTEGLALERQQVSALRHLLTGLPAASADLAQVTARAGIWRAVTRSRRSGRCAPPGSPSPARRPTRARPSSMPARRAEPPPDRPDRERRHAAAGLNGSATTLNAISLVVIGISLLVT